MNRRGLSTQLTGESVLRMMEEEMVLVVDPDSLWSVGQEVQDPVPQCGAQSKGGEPLLQGLWDDGAESEGKVR